MVCMYEETELRKRIARKLEESSETGIEYSYFEGKLRVGTESYNVGQRSFSEIASTVLGTLKDLYGEYETIPKTFNAETYENERFSAEVLALGGQGYLGFIVRKKEVVR